jgi:hypothetical protein
MLFRLGVVFAGRLSINDKPPRADAGLPTSCVQTATGPSLYVSLRAGDVADIEPH